MDFSWILGKVQFQRASRALGGDSRECMVGSTYQGVRRLGGCLPPLPLETLGKQTMWHAVKMDVWSNHTSVALFEAVVDQCIPLSKRVKQKVLSVN